jgi:hypothetical protein
VDAVVDRHDPGALRRSQDAVRNRNVTITPSPNGNGTYDVEASVLATDGEALDHRLDAMAAAVCDGDPRTLEQRRADALGALGHGHTRLTCLCGAGDCLAAEAQPSAVVVHVIADERAPSEDTAGEFDGAPTRQPDDPPGPAGGPPAVILGGGVLPGPLLADTIAPTATIVPIVHPGDAPAERRRIPSAVLAWFIRGRDLTCRFPGCDAPAHLCDVDHTIPYPYGPTQASNLKCLCRKHHLLNTFGGWHDEQHPDGTVIWTSPTGQTYTTHPGSRLLFPTLCRPTAPVEVDESVELVDNAARTLRMPRRTRTRAQARAARIDAERRLNDAHVAERNKPPPF